MKKGQQYALLAILMGVGFFVYGASDYSPRVRYSDNDRVSLAFGAVLIVGGSLVYKYGWPPE